MATEDWRYQGGDLTAVDNTYGVTVVDDGTIVGVGRTEGAISSSYSNLGSFDFFAVKLGSDSSGGVEVLWEWQGGTTGDDVFNEAVANPDGSTVVVGYSHGNWNGTNAGLSDFVVTKFSEEGTVLWKRQSGTPADDGFVAMVPVTTSASTGSAFVMAGRTLGDWASTNAGGIDLCAAAIDSDGNELWKWQDGSSSNDTTKSIAVGSDGSIFVAGYTLGEYGQPNAGDTDFCLAKLDAEGTLEWRWQDGTVSEDVLSQVLVGRDGGIVLVGYSTGTWGDESNLGEEDFVVVKLDADGSELWRWQDGTPESDKIFGGAMLADDSIVVTGHTEGDWAEASAGGSDFFAARLDANGTEIWRWQDGTDSSDWVTETAAASLAAGGRTVALAGSTKGSWDGISSNDGLEDFAITSLDVGTVDPIPTPAPSLAPTLAPTLTPTLAPTLAPTRAPVTARIVPASIAPTRTVAPAPSLAPTSPAPTPAPSFSNSTISPVIPTPPEETDLESTLIYVGVSVVCAALGALLLVFVKRRRDSKRKVTQTFAPTLSNSDHILEQGLEQPPDVPPPPYAEAVGGTGEESPPPCHQDDTLPHQRPPAEAHELDGGGVLSASVQPGVEHGKSTAAAEDRGAHVAGEGAAGSSLEKEGAAPARIATVSTANISTTDRDELVHQWPSVADVAPVGGGGTNLKEYSGGDPGDASPAVRDGSTGSIGLSHVVLAVAEELARNCQILGVSEAATAVCVMAKLVADSRENAAENESRLRQCDTIIMALKRATKVVERGGATIGEVARGMIEDVQGAISDLVELIKTYQSKNRLSRLFLSTLFKRRQHELDAVVDRAINRLQLGLQLQVGQDVSAVKDDVSAVKDDFKSAKEEMHLFKQSLSEAAAETVAEDRRIKRQRKLDKIEIPEEHLIITDELLGKGGFGEVYLADYNGHNAAAKVLYIAQDVRALEDNQIEREKRQRKAFLRELAAMIRLRSLNTVNVYGAVTSMPDRMVLVMELLSGGDLLTMLRKSKEPLPEGESRRIIRDVCTGMGFLHSKNTIHGDLKSANVLLDGDGRAKIADFGTSRWTQHTASTGLATFTSKVGTQMSIAWSAPELLESEGSSRESDVYSFGIVVWEVMTRELPWAKKTRQRDILTAVLRGDRPSFRLGTPADIVDIANACWRGESKERTTFRTILEGMKNSKVWSDQYE